MKKTLLAILGLFTGCQTKVVNPGVNNDGTTEYRVQVIKPTNDTVTYVVKKVFLGGDFIYMTVPVGSRIDILEQPISYTEGKATTAVVNVTK